MFQFITKRPFWVNLLVAIALLVGLLFSVLWALGYITHHGQYERVPAVVGKTSDDAIRILQEKGFNVEIQDSVWVETETASAVLRQLPAGEEMVKAKRTIYLTINRAFPPMVEMPNLVGLSFRNAELYVRQLGFKLGDTSRKPDIAKDAVLEQLYLDEQIKPGTKIYQGSTISFVLGSGIGSDEMEVPQLVGLTFQEAKNYLQSIGVHTGAILADEDVSDTANAYIIRQNPSLKTVLPDGAIQTNKIRAGQSIDLWIAVNKPVIVSDSTGNEP
ncbi:MAG TPA: PASTA domain-containing protein [Phnomibacter sp.]|nr:PASTA domain-containing protein [Phnomibacter sp.]